MAPCYKKFLLAIRLKSERKTEVLITNANINAWLPGDNIYDDHLFTPADLPAGEYDLQVGIVDPESYQPKIKLAIEGRDEEGWYSIGNIEVR